MSSTTETRKSHVGNADGASAPATVHEAELHRLPRDPIGLGAGALLAKADLSQSRCRQDADTSFTDRAGDDRHPMLVPAR